MPIITPFGNPDGARSDINEVLNNFVEFDPIRFKGLGLLYNDLSTRVVAGIKGSGKTVYLRRIQDAARNNESVFTDFIQHEPPSTHDIIKFCQIFPESELDDMWERLWYCAILQSLSSYLLYHPQLRNLIPDDVKDGLKEHGFKFSTPVSIYSQATSILNSFNSPNAFRRFLYDDSWNNVIYYLKSSMSSLPPMFLFIDSVDERYEKAPMFWLRAQQGLFYRVMRFVRDQQLGGKIHITISIREQVLSSVFRSEDQLKYRSQENVKVLEWDYESLLMLMREKIKKLDKDYLLNPELIAKENYMEAWLGHKEIKNVARGITEPLEDYIIRHARSSPRDIVQLGNVLSEQVVIYKNTHGDKEKALPMDLIRAVIAQEARRFGDQQIQITANQISSSSMPIGSWKKRNDSLYTGDQEFIKTYADKTKEIIADIGRDRFTWEHLQEAEKVAKKLLDPSIDFFSILWQNRIIGFKNMNEQTIHFYSDQNLGNFKLPPRKSEYVFHPCIIDTTQIVAVGAVPPIPGKNYY